MLLRTGVVFIQVLVRKVQTADDIPTTPITPAFPVGAPQSTTETAAVPGHACMRDQTIRHEGLKQRVSSVHKRRDKPRCKPHWTSRTSKIRPLPVKSIVQT